MRLIVESEGRTIDIRIRRDDLETLKAVQQAAAHLLAAVPATKTPTPSTEPFGYSVGTDTELATDAPEPHDAEDQA
jgi:hypothetical protein